MFHDSGAKLPPGVGTRTPDQVAEAVARGSSAGARESTWPRSRFRPAGSRPGSCRARWRGSAPHGGQRHRARHGRGPGLQTLTPHFSRIVVALIRERDGARAGAGRRRISAAPVRRLPATSPTPTAPRLRGLPRGSRNSPWLERPCRLALRRHRQLECALPSLLAPCRGIGDAHDMLVEVDVSAISARNSSNACAHAMITWRPSPMPRAT